MGDRGHGGPGVQGFHRDDAEVAGGNFAGVAARLDVSDNFALAGQAQAVAVDGLDMGPIGIIGPDLDLLQLAEMGAEQAADGAATDDTHFHSLFSLDCPQPQWSAGCCDQPSSMALTSR